MNAPVPYGGMNRLPNRGQFIDRARPVTFSFEGNFVEGYEGDTIASALAANGQWIVSRSFKYHRPRGVLTMIGQDANTLVQVGDEPNCLADKRKIAPGLVVEGQNYFGTFESDAGRFVEWVSKFLPVGFYYKTFHEKRASWRLWEPIVRKMAGLGKIDPHAHHGYYDKQYLFADVAVIGGGPAGMAAAVEAAKAGGEVILIDENPKLGGNLNYALFDESGEAACKAEGDLLNAVQAAGNIKVMTDAVVSGLFADNWIPIIRGSRFYKLRAKSIVVATGSIEQPAVFRNNDLPGIMLGSAAQRLIHFYGVRPGKKAVILTANDDGYAQAIDLLKIGSEVAAVVDLRAVPPVTPLSFAAHKAGITVHAGCAISEASHLGNKQHVSSVIVAPVAGEGVLGDPIVEYACDLVLMSVGYSPAAHLLLQAGAKFAYDTTSHMFMPNAIPAGLFAAGSVAGSFKLDAVKAGGSHAGWAAARHAGLKAGVGPGAPDLAADPNQTYPWPIFPHKRGGAFVDFDEDLKYEDLINGIADGFDNVELLKRYSTVGMGPSQGKHSAVAAVRIVARETGRDLGSLTVTTQRPPYTPEKFGHLAGRIFDPERRTAMHHRHLELGAQMMPAGIWWRPAYYGSKAERDKAIHDEVRAVRNNVGLIDVSTLGGLDVRGPDAAEFLNRMYTFTYTKLPVGKSRYVLMTDQAGVITDDGVACRFSEEHFYVTATTSGVDAVYRSMLQWNAQWRLDVDVANVTAAYAGVNIAGPKSRAVLQKVCTDIDLSSEAFPYLGVRMGTVAGIPARLLRVGFVGELGYEIHVPYGYGEALWDALVEAGAAESIRPFGVEAQRVLRLEKGHIIVSQDTDGLTNVWEADMPWAIAKTKPFFVGSRSTQIMAKMPMLRKLVGFTLDDPSLPCPEECHLVIRGGEIVGRVTSAVKSPNLGKVVGLAYVHPDDAKPDAKISIKIDGGRMIEARVVALPFYDPQSKRQEM
jgi:sarcosine oxidase subunit alpha